MENLVFLFFGLWVKDLAIFDLKIGFLVKNYEYKPNFVKNAPCGAENLPGVDNPPVNKVPRIPTKDVSKGSESESKLQVCRSFDQLS